MAAPAAAAAAAPTGSQARRQKRCKAAPRPGQRGVADALFRAPKAAPDSGHARLASHTTEHKRWEQIDPSRIHAVLEVTRAEKTAPAHIVHASGWSADVDDTLAWTVQAREGAKILTCRLVPTPVLWGNPAVDAFLARRATAEDFATIAAGAPHSRWMSSGVGTLTDELKRETHVAVAAGCAPDENPTGALLAKAVTDYIQDAATAQYLAAALPVHTLAIAAAEALPGPTAELHKEYAAAQIVEAVEDAVLRMHAASLAPPCCLERDRRVRATPSGVRTYDWALPTPRAAMEPSADAARRAALSRIIRPPPVAAATRAPGPREWADASAHRLAAELLGAAHPLTARLDAPAAGGPSPDQSPDESDASSDAPGQQAPWAYGDGFWPEVRPATAPPGRPDSAPPSVAGDAASGGASARAPASGGHSPPPPVGSQRHCSAGGSPSQTSEPVAGGALRRPTPAEQEDIDSFGPGPSAGKSAYMRLLGVADPTAE